MTYKHDHGGADPLDAAVGRQLKARRQLAGLSQGALGDSVGVSFQQIQKYESGANRISTGHLLRFCHRLRVEPGRFLAEAVDGLAGPEGGFGAEAEADNPNMLALMRHARRLAPVHLDCVRKLAQTLAGAQPRPSADSGQPSAGGLGHAA